MSSGSKPAHSYRHAILGGQELPSIGADDGGHVARADDAVRAISPGIQDGGGLPAESACAG